MLGNRKSGAPNVQWESKEQLRGMEIPVFPEDSLSWSIIVKFVSDLSSCDGSCLNKTHILCVFIYADIVDHGTLAHVQLCDSRYQDRLLRAPPKCRTEIALLLINRNRRNPFNQIPSISRARSSKSRALLWMRTNGRMWSSRRGPLEKVLTLLGRNAIFHFLLDMS